MRMRSPQNAMRVSSPYNGDKAKSFFGGTARLTTKIALAFGLFLIVIFLMRSDTFGGTPLPKVSGMQNRKCATVGKRYGIMMDAGSTGSRIHAFEFNYHADGAVELIDELFEQTKPGLSAFAADPKAGANSLRPLLDAALKKIPVEAQACTPIELKATAGLRLIGESKSEALLTEVYHLFKAYPFAVAGPEAAIVMDGKDEGPYAWMTVNFLLDTLNTRTSAKTAAIVDMGGASTQIVFRPDDEAIMSRVDPAQTYQVITEGFSTKVYTHSHLGYGLKQANKFMMKESLTKFEKAMPCFPKGVSETVDGVSAANVDGEQSFEKCYTLARTILYKNKKCEALSCSFNGIAQPLLSGSFTGPIYVFSYYYDRMEAFLNADGVSSVGELKKIAEGVCTNAVPPYSDHNKGTMCMDLTYLYALLRDGYDISDESKLYVKKKIKGIETAWSLGAMMVAMKPKQ
jgi:guanosine-diphosphatase